MPTHVNVNAPRLVHQTRGSSEGAIGGAIVLMIAVVGLICLAVGAIYLGSVVGPVELQDVGQFVGP